MIANYFTLKALVQEWQGLRNSVLAELFTQSKDELTLAIGTPEQDFTLKILARPDIYGIFLNDGYSRARKNTASLFEEIHGKTILDITLSPLDRIVVFNLSGGYDLQIHLYPPRPNVLLIKKKTVKKTFLHQFHWENRPAPVFEAKELPFYFEWIEQASEKENIKELKKHFPVFPELIAKEVFYRAAKETKSVEIIVKTVLAELNEPNPRVYLENGRATFLSLIPLHHVDAAFESFTKVGDAVTVYCRKRLSEKRFNQQYQPLFKVLSNAIAKLSQQSEQLFEELAKPSRAEKYEAFGHLLMANPRVKITEKTVTLPDFYSDNQIEIGVDKQFSIVENAERYYNKARKSKQARINAESRSFELFEKVEKGKKLLKILQDIKHYTEIETFKKDYQSDLKFFIGSKTETIALAPYRLFELNGFEILVGRNAKCNDELTFKIAKKTDLWLHARGVSGSHVVIRRSNPKQRPPQSVVEYAASLAAHFSQAKTSGMVPVQMTERKHIRKPKAFLPGAVLVSQEEVILIEPWKG